MISIPGLNSTNHGAHHEIILVSISINLSSYHSRILVTAWIAIVATWWYIWTIALHIWNPPDLDCFSATAPVHCLNTIIVIHGRR